MVFLLRIIDFIKRLFKREEVVFTNDQGQMVDFVSSTGNESITMLGRYASSALKNPAIDATLKKMEASITRKWEMSAGKDKDRREHYYYQIQALAQFQLILKGMVNNMIVEENKQKNLRDKRDFK